MIFRRCLLACAALFLISAAWAGTPSHESALAALAPPAGRLIHGTYPGGFTGDEDDITLAQVKAYERAVGRHVAWIYFSHNWFNGRAFPTATAKWIIAHGSTPYMRLMMRSDSAEFKREPVYTLKRIARGDFDDDLARWGRDAAALGVPILAEFGTEMNGAWFRWNARWNGRTKGAARFRAAFRHIVEVTRAAGATNIVWVFHANNGDDPVTAWNRMEAYYPGDDVIDWLAISAYGMLAPDDWDRVDFRATMDSTYARLTRMAPDKPVILAEFGTDIHNPREPAAAWAKGALADILGHRWPRLIGFSLWNETWLNEDGSVTDLRVWKDPALAAEFRHALAKAALVTRR